MMTDPSASALDHKQFHFGIGWSWNHPGELRTRGKRAWVSSLAVDLFGPVWVWKPVRISVDVLPGEAS
jgi:hypothetical protein